MSNPLNLVYDHNPVTQVGSFAVTNFVDEITDFSAAASARQMHTSVRLLTVGGMAASFNGNQQVLDFQMNNLDELCVIKNMSVRLELNNNDGTNPAILLPSHFMLDFFEILLESGQVETCYNFNQFYDHFYFAKNDEKLNNDQVLYEYVGGYGNVNYGSGLTIAAGGQAVVYLDLPNMFSKTPIFIKHLQKNITVRLHLHPTGMTTASTSTGISVSSADLLVSGLQFEASVQQALCQRYRSMDHLFPYYEPIRALVPNQAISATSKSNIKITELSGQLVSQLAVLMIPTGSINDGLYNFQPMLRMDLLRSGRTIGSFQNVPADYWKLQMGNLFNTTAVRTNNIYVLSFTNNPVAAGLYGAQRGGVYMTTNDIIEIQAVTGGTFDVYVLAYRLDILTVFKNGNLAVTSIGN